MTAEVGIMNTIGVALAADSAVTIGADARKIFTSADKLFQLTLNAPVGIMIYGNVSLLGVPWETLIKEYRRTLAGRTFDRVEQYCLDFLSFVEQRTDLLPRKLQASYVMDLLHHFFLELRDKHIQNDLDEKAEEQGGLAEDDVANIVSSVVSRFSACVKEVRALRSLRRNCRERIRQLFSADIRALKKAVFGHLPLNRSTDAKLSRLAVELLVRECFSTGRTGIVIAGFGNSEFMPSLYSLEIDGMLDGKLRQARRAERRIGSAGMEACVLPFAQQDMVWMFMQGIDKRVEKYCKQSTQAVLKGTVEAIVSTVGETHPQLAERLKTTLLPGLDSSLEKLFREWSLASRQHWEPVVEIVATLPKDELAAMAESLVNLTKFRHKVTPHRETVGGPIDVAIITKGDGFVWIKRKHYFDAQLNPRVLSRIGGCVS